MTELELLVVIVGGMLVTYATRLSFTVLIPPEHMPPALKRGLTYIPPAVLAAILLPAVLLVEGSLVITPGNHQLVAAIAATFVAWRLRNTWLTIGSGLLVLWLLTVV